MLGNPEWIFASGIVLACARVGLKLPGEYPYSKPTTYQHHL